MIKSKFIRKEKSLQIEGLKIAYQVSGHPQNPPLLCFHGWQDNLASFDLISAYLSAHYFVITVDFPGHGKSEGYGHSANYSIFEYVNFVFEFLEALKISQAYFLGHSLGGAVLSLFAATFPEKVKKLAMVEALGPLSMSEKDAVEHLRRSIYDSHNRKNKKNKIPYYKTVKEMLLRRIRVSDMDDKTVSVFLPRSIRKTKKGYTWRTDPFVKVSSRVRLLESQLIYFFEKIKCPLLFLQADPGMGGNHQLIEERKKAIPHLYHKKIPGGHHVHIERAEEVGALLLDFYLI